MKSSKTLKVATLAIAALSLQGCSLYGIVSRYGKVMDIEGTISRYNYANDRLDEYIVTGTFPSVPVKGLKSTLNIEHHGSCEGVVVNSSPGESETSGVIYYKCKHLGNETIAFHVSNDTNNAGGKIQGYLDRFYLNASIKDRTKPND